MKLRSTLLVLAAAGFLGACGEAEQPKPADGETSALESAMQKAGEGAAQIKEAAAEVAEAAARSTDELAAAASARAEELLAQAQGYIAEGKTELAEGVLVKLQAMKDSLSESMRATLAEMEQRLASAGTQVPGGSPETGGAAGDVPEPAAGAQPGSAAPAE